MNRFFTGTFAATFIAASLSIVPVAPVLAQSQPVSGPRPGTQAALQCLLRQGPHGCEQMFVGKAFLAARPWVYQNNDRDFNRGPLQSSSFYGQASANNVFDEKILHRLVTDNLDIYDVKFAHVEWSLYIAPADPDGKIRYLAIELYAPHDLDQLRM